MKVLNNMSRSEEHMFTNNEIAGYFRFDHKQEKRAVKY